jgi:hypothetical protein
MAAPRPFLIVLLIIVVLVLIFFVLGLTGIFSPPKANLDDLRKSFSGHHLLRRDLRTESGCVGPGDQLQIKNGTCTLVAPKSSDPVWRRRSVVLKALGGTIHVTVVPFNKDERTVKGDPGSDEAEFYIGRDGARIEIECPGTCTVTLQP